MKLVEIPLEEIKRIENDEEDMVYYIDPYYVHVFRRSDEDIDYTIYDAEFKAIDGGVYDNRTLPFTDIVDAIFENFLDDDCSVIEQEMVDNALYRTTPIVEDMNEWYEKI